MDCKAKPEDWELQTQWASDCQDARCLLELRARVEALEANSKPTPNPSQIRSSLVEQVMTAIERADGDDEARAAICEVARWLDAEAHQRGLQPHNGVYAAADWLRGELEAEQ